MTRRLLPDTHDSRTLKLSLGGQDYYVTLGFHDDGAVGGVTIRAGHVGGTQPDPVDPGPLLEAMAQSISIALEHGAPIERFVHLLAHTRFPPAGFTGDPKAPRVSSVLDYVAKRIAVLLGITLDGAVQANEQAAATGSDGGE